MRIAGIRLTNYERFRGEHEIDLEAGVYGVIARSSANPDRSNWLGKSSLLSAVRFALFGSVRGDTLDAVISRGESAVGVDLELSDGLFVTRSRDRGKSTQLRVLVPHPDGSERELFQAEAQREIIRRIGLDEDEWLATAWCEQGQAARIVRATPAERTTTINGWLALEPLELAAAFARKRHAQLSTDRERLAGELQGIDRTLAEPEPDPKQVEEIRKQIEETKVLQDMWHRVIQEMAAWEKARDKRVEWEGFSKRLVALSQELAAFPEPSPLEPLETAHARALAAVEAAVRRTQEVRSLAKGKFDGICPVTLTACSVADQVRAECMGNRDAIDHADAALNDARQAAQAPREALARARLAHDNRDRLRREIGALEARVMVEPKDPGDAPYDLDPSAHAPPDPSEAIAALSRIETLRAQRAKLRERREELVSQMAELDGQIRAQLEAAAVLGRGGAQRRVAENAVTSIQERANARLASVGIDLNVSIEWGRQLRGLADTCERCGVAFPKSTKARECAKCGATRPPKRDDRLYLDLSDRSGAAEDLAGLSIQLAAAAWLQARKQAAWSVVALDEPFGQLDQENRRSFARSVQAIAGAGFDQAFVVAHSADVLEALPRRIVITGGEHWSTLAVE